jgi:hypothetical protein
LTEAYLELLAQLKIFIDSQKDQRRIQRDIYSIFSIVQEHYKGYNSFETLSHPETFNLSACEFFLKHIGDYFVIRGINTPQNANTEPLSQKIKNTCACDDVFSPSK